MAHILGAIGLHFICLLVGGLLAFAGAAITYFYMNRKRQQDRQAHTQQLQGAEKRQAVLVESILAQEKERQRLAKDLQMDIGTALSAIKYYMNQLHADPTNINTYEVAEIALAMVEDVIGQLSAVSKRLKANTLEGMGLMPAFEEYFHNLRLEKGVRTQFTFEGEDVHFEPHEKLGFFRVVEDMVRELLADHKGVQLTVIMAVTPQGLLVHAEDEFGNKRSRQLYAQEHHPPAQSGKVHSLASLFYGKDKTPPPAGNDGMSLAG